MEAERAKGQVVEYKYINSRVIMEVSLCREGPVCSLTDIGLYSERNGQFLKGFQHDSDIN